MGDLQNKFSSPLSSPLRPFQNEQSALSAQFEALDKKYSAADKMVKSLKEQLKETEEQLKEETRQKIASSNKLKQLEDEVQRLNQQLEDEEEIKAGIQTKMVQATQQVREGERGRGRYIVQIWGGEHVLTCMWYLLWEIKMRGSTCMYCNYGNIHSVW